MQTSEIRNYTEILRRRKYRIIIPVLLSILGGMVYFLQAPKVYEAVTLILVQPQRVPGNYVRPITEGTVEDRLKTISQQVTSRTNLEQITAQYKLGAEYENPRDPDELVNAVRKRIAIDVKAGRHGETSSFTIAFQAGEPETAMKVANALASNFITENLKQREEQAMGTSGFLLDELDAMRKRLAAKEDELKQYRERYMGGLPEQLQANLSILERLEGQSTLLANSLRDSENRKILIQAQIAPIAKAREDMRVPAVESTPVAKNLQTLRSELVSLVSRYTSDHPDVIRLREMISALERESPVPTENGTVRKEESAIAGVDLALRKQVREIESEIVGLREEIKINHSQITSYRTKVEDMPRREQELLSLNRDYENLKGLYSSLLNRKLEADIAVSMERKQKGEQFRVIDPAKTPTRPIKPDIYRIALVTLAIGLGLGGGVAYLEKIMDSSYQTPEEIEKDLRIPVLVSIPVRHSAQETRRRKRMEFLKAASVSVGFAVSAAGIILAAKGITKTVEFMNSLIQRI
jgi:polysaccharide chain length determinant protein (PEP-CTERM system associated)